MVTAAQGSRGDASRARGTRRWELIEGDVLEVVSGLPTGSFDAVLTDPPYGLGDREPTVEEIIAYLRGESGLDTGGDFMGADWELPPVAVWRELLRVLRPGGHGFGFAGTRTQDLVTIGMRAGGWEIRDVVDWVYGQGSPKSVDIERAVSVELCTLEGRHYASSLPDEEDREPGDHLCPTAPEGAPHEGWGTGLRPAREPVVLIRKPLEDTIARTVLTHGTGGMHVDGARLGESKRVPSSLSKAGVHGWGTGAADNPGKDPNVGRWPTNFVLSHTALCEFTGMRRVKASNPTGQAQSTTELRVRGVYDGGEDPNSFRGNGERVFYGDDGVEVVEAWDCVPGCPVRQIDEQSGDRPGMSGGGAHREGYGGGMFGAIDSTHTARGDSGGASRFFFCAKASRYEREFGCEKLPARTAAEATKSAEGAQRLKSPRTGAGRTADKVRNFHPTVKPIDLLVYLSTLIRPARTTRPLRILVPYAGSGSEMIACLRSGWDEVVGIQRAANDDERGYLAIARARIDRWESLPAHIDPRKVARVKVAPEQGALF